MGNTHRVIHIDKRKKKPVRIISKRKKDNKIKRSVDNGDDKKPRGRGKKSRRARVLMDVKRSALGSKGGPKSNKRVGKSESRR